MTFISGTTNSPYCHISEITTWLRYTAPILVFLYTIYFTIKSYHQNNKKRALILFISSIPLTALTYIISIIIIIALYFFTGAIFGGRCR